MRNHEMLERRSEMLKRRIGELIAKENQYGLGRQESHFLQMSIRELHQTAFELNGKIQA
ncbi:hypothetical protein M3201_24635 [Paenibacillus motobuensis]|uniref:hypothetical protein n=1 Tax=Paenibacillus TaxID=44249 RepID=UPI00203C126E|nr:MULTISPECIES: hypothetical protein [Paenibacillus]MCM3042850.1 hypothetical protein [Paenibacillus lutimineralis]MCM3649954.1 hypothetical protein [Paenibacillus motobuensis]